MLFSMSKRYKIKAGSSVSRFLPPKGSGGTGLGISRGGTGHRWHHLCPCIYRVLGENAQILCIFPASSRGGFLHLPDLLGQAALPPGAPAAQPPHPALSLHFGAPSPHDSLPPSRWFWGHALPPAHPSRNPGASPSTQPLLPQTAIGFFLPPLLTW